MSDETGPETSAPDACTLPTADRPIRQAEFDELFRRTVGASEPLTATSARFRLRGPADLADRVRDLITREQECCSFFEFGVTTEGPDVVVLDVTVPAVQVAVLKAMIDRADAIRNQP